MDHTTFVIHVCAINNYYFLQSIMVEQCYPAIVNKLLRRYLKFKRIPEFDRLAAYADLWEVNDDATHILRALRGLRVGD